MACTNCSTGTKDGTPRGCKNNGTCGTDSCNKLTVFDWLSNMSLPGGEAPFDCVEVRFKNGRKEFYRNTEKLTLSIGDIVATEASPGHDIGIVTLTGELVKMQMKKKGEKPDGDVPKIYRKASQKDIDIWSESRAREEPMKVIARELAIKLKLEMKISDIEFQGDASKATFYYTANDRVDFRQLIKDFAREFSIRIEMKQVGFRQEAARLGGIGSCGRELCCSTWLTDFRSVNTSAARYQQLSLNPQKLAGQCGKLKCCLNYELDTYLDALKGLPDMDTKLYTEKGDAFCQKVDIFKGLMWFAYVNDMAHWHVLEADQVKEIIALNKQKERVASLEDYAIELESENAAENFQNAVGQDSLTRFDKPKPKKKHKNKPKEGAAADRPSNRDNRGDQGARPQRDNRPQNRDNRDRDAAPKDNANKPQNRDNRDNAAPRDNANRPQNRDNAPRENKGGNRPQQPKKDNREGGNNRPNNAPRQGQTPNAGGENTNAPQNNVSNTNNAGGNSNRNKNKRRRPSGDKNSPNDKNSPSE